jgi:hypothetical protein
MRRSSTPQLSRRFRNVIAERCVLCCQIRFRFLSLSHAYVSWRDLGGFHLGNVFPEILKEAAIPRGRGRRD